MKTENEKWVEEQRRKEELKTRTKTCLFGSLYLTATTVVGGLIIWPNGKGAILSFYNLLFFLMTLVWMLEMTK